jgi:hypothetical protein
MQTFGWFVLRINQSAERGSAALILWTSQSDRDANGGEPRVQAYFALPPGAPRDVGNWFSVAEEKSGGGRLAESIAAQFVEEIMAFVLIDAAEKLSGKPSPTRE